MSEGDDREAESKTVTRRYVITAWDAAVGMFDGVCDVTGEEVHVAPILPGTKIGAVVEVTTTPTVRGRWRLVTRVLPSAEMPS